MTMTLELSEEQERVLREAAEQAQTSPENVVRTLIGTLAQNGAGNGVAATVSPQQFDAIVNSVLRDNAELYRRLA